MDQTISAVTHQVRAMGCEVFEVGLFKPTATGNEPVMLPRTWDADALLRSVRGLRHQNREGRNIFIRPKGEHNLSLVDDLTAGTVENMKVAGYAPALVIQTSPGNFQAWLRHREPLSKEVSTAAARKLAEQFGGDRGAADWRHFGRLAGFTNRKEKYKDEKGLYPFVLVAEHTGLFYAAASEFTAQIRSNLVAVQSKRNAPSSFRASLTNDPIKSIEVFRTDPRYGGDGTRIDLAYAIYALSHGLDEPKIRDALRTRDLSHKGN